MATKITTTNFDQLLHRNLTIDSAGKLDQWRSGYANVNFTAPFHPSYTVNAATLMNGEQK